MFHRLMHFVRCLVVNWKHCNIKSTYIITYTYVYWKWKYWLGIQNKRVELKLNVWWRRETPRKKDWLNHIRQDRFGLLLLWWTVKVVTCLPICRQYVAQDSWLLKILNGAKKRIMYSILYIHIYESREKEREKLLCKYFCAQRYFMLSLLCLQIPRNCIKHFFSLIRIKKQQ